MPGPLANVFFERAKGCDMDVFISFLLYMGRRKRRSLTPRNLIIPKLSPGQRIRTLSVQVDSWERIQELVSGWADALFPLEKLEIDTNVEYPAPQPTVFVGEALKSPSSTGLAIPGLYNILAPNLTVLNLADSSLMPCSVMALFDFLDTSPSLEDVEISTRTTCDFPPPHRKVTLPHVRRIALDTGNTSQVASQLICPSVTTTRLADAFPDDNDTFPPALRSLLAQYSVESIDKVLVHVSDRVGAQRCSLQFHAPSGTTFWYTCQTDDPSGDIWSFPLLLDETVSALQALPLNQVVALAIDIPAPSQFVGDPDFNQIRTKLAEVLEKCSILQEVVLESYGPSCFPDFSREKTPPIRTLIIKHPEGVSWEELVENITGVARVRHTKGKPLDKVEIFTAEGHPEIEQLKSLVQEVMYREIGSWGKSRGIP